ESVSEEGRRPLPVPGRILGKNAVNTSTTEKSDEAKAVLDDEKGSPTASSSSEARNRTSVNSSTVLSHSLSDRASSRSNTSSGTSSEIPSVQSAHGSTISTPIPTYSDNSVLLGSTGVEPPSI